MKNLRLISNILKECEIEHMIDPRIAAGTGKVNVFEDYKNDKLFIKKIEK